MRDQKERKGTFQIWKMRRGERWLVLHRKKWVLQGDGKTGHLNLYQVMMGRKGFTPQYCRWRLRDAFLEAVLQIMDSIASP